MDKSKIYKIPLFIVIIFAIISIVHYSNIDFIADDLFITEKTNRIITSLNSVTSDVEELKKQALKFENKIEEIKLELVPLMDRNSEISLYISALEVICAKTDMRGPGIIIRVDDNLTDDPFNVLYKIVHDFDVRTIINDLNKNGAEAISINGNRIINTTEVICVGPVIRVNGVSVASPFIIKAIGDPDMLMEAITDQNSYAYDIKTNYGIDITAIKSSDISISRNYQELDIEYAKLEEEGE